MRVLDVGLDPSGLKHVPLGLWTHTGQGAFGDHLWARDEAGGGWSPSRHLDRGEGSRGPWGWQTDADGDRGWTPGQVSACREGWEGILPCPKPRPVGATTGGNQPQRFRARSGARACARAKTRLCDDFCCFVLRVWHGETGVGIQFL